MPPAVPLAALAFLALLPGCASVGDSVHVPTCSPVDTRDDGVAFTCAEPGTYASAVLVPGCPEGARLALAGQVDEGRATLVARAADAPDGPQGSVLGEVRRSAPWSGTAEGEAPASPYLHAEVFLEGFSGQVEATVRCLAA